MDNARTHLFFSQLAKGATDSLWLTAGQTFTVLVVFVFSFKYGVGGFSRRDKSALIAAGFGLVLWYITDDASFALIMVILVDAIGSLLIMIKSYETPESETLITWILSGTSGVFGVLAVGQPNWILIAYPLYIAVANYAITGAILLGRRKKSQVTFKSKSY